MAKKYKKDFIKEIVKGGFPILVCFDHWDSSAMIYAVSEDTVYVDDYGSQFLEENIAYRSRYSLTDLSEKGVYNLLKDGVRPGDDDWNFLIDEAKELEKDSNTTVIPQTEKKIIFGTDKITVCDLCGEQIFPDKHKCSTMYKCDVCGKDVCEKCGVQYPNAHARTLCNGCNTSRPDLASLLRWFTQTGDAKSAIEGVMSSIESEYTKTKIKP